MNVHITAECFNCRPTYLDDDTPRDIAAMDDWWESVGKHSDYFRAILTDDGGEKPMQTAIQSPYFRRDDPRAAEAALGCLMGAVARSLTHRFTPELVPS